MIYVSQNWKDEQTKQLRPEGDVKIEFYSGASLGGLTYVTEINKANISNFSFRTSGKVENVNVPSVNINLELIKGTYSEIKRGYVAKLFYGFLINGSWEYHLVDYYRVTEVSIPANGLVDKFVLKMVSDDTLTKQYTKGSNGGNLDPIKFINKVYGYADYLEAKTDLANYNDVLIGMSLGNCSKIEALQLVGIACGKTLIIKNILSITFQEYTFQVADNNIYYREIAPTDADTHYDYVISPNNSYTFPELQNSMAVSNLVITEYTNTLGDVARTFNEVFTEFSTINRSWTKQFDVLYYKITFSTKAGTFSSQSATLNGYTATWSAWKSTNIARTEVYLYDMTTTAEQHTYTINSTGEDFYVDNELINENYLTPASNYLRAWLPFQDYIECDYRIDPRLELFDKIVVVDKSNNGHVVIVEEITINFNSSFSGKIRGRVLTTFDATVQPVTVVDYGDNFDCVHFYNPNPFAVTVTVKLSSGLTTSTNIASENDGTIWADEDNRPMRAEKNKMLNHELVTDTMAETSMLGAPTIKAGSETLVYYALKKPLIAHNEITAGGFDVVIVNQNNYPVTMTVTYSGGTLTFTIPANYYLQLNPNNASALSSSAQEKYYGDLGDVVDCMFAVEVPLEDEETRVLYSLNETIWEADY